MEKKVLGTSDAWSTSHLSHRAREPAYYIVDCRIYTILTVLRVGAAAAIRHANGYTNSTLCMTASRWLLSIDENH